MPHADNRCCAGVRAVIVVLVCASTVVAQVQTLAQGGAAPQPGAPSLLDRNDNNRSQFAGSNLRRVQSFGQPSNPDGGGDSGQPSLYAPSNPLNTRVYKETPVMGVYLNGINIVGLRSQTLRGVTVRFDEQGNIQIDAPHYDVQLDSSFHPLLPSEVPGRPKENAPWPTAPKRPQAGETAKKPAAPEAADADPLADAP